MRRKLIKPKPLIVAATGNLTAGNCRLDLTSTNAFCQLVGVDMSGYVDGTYILHLTDATGKVVWGKISSEVSEGETYTDLVTGDNSTFASDTGWWSRGAGISLEDGVCHFNTDSNQALYRLNSGNQQGKLLHVSFDISNYVRGVPAISIFAYSSGVISAWTSDGTKTKYFTSPGDTAHIYVYGGSFSSGGQWDLDNLVVRSVDTPDTPANGGVLITNAASARAWIANGGVNPNAAITYKIMYQGS